MITSNTDMDLAKRIRQIRIDNHLTQEQVAKALDATPGYICNVENGRTAMSLRMLVYFAKLTNTTLDSLVGSMDSSYTATAIDNEIMGLLADFSDAEKMKLIKTLRIWKDK
ncbi:MAG: helix-turn-helix transcriptional regulator [Lachnospiraceae bacterium]|nr:helix-turn-helix transcriptional regulator [Lachnospiraceae bacterium]